MPRAANVLAECLARQGLQEGDLPALGIPADWLHDFRHGDASIDDMSDSELQVFLKVTRSTYRFWRGIDAMRRSKNTMTPEEQQHYANQFMKR
jgi:hypothetical protein